MTRPVRAGLVALAMVTIGVPTGQPPSTGSTPAGASAPAETVPAAPSGPGLAASSTASATPDGAADGRSASAGGGGCATVAGDAPIHRLAGPDRWATAACTSAAGYPDGADVVLLARGDDAGGWADALAGTVLAAAVDGPVLLTAPRTLPDATAAEIERLGAGTVLVLGGTAAITPPVVDAVEDLGAGTERISGPDRAATAVEVARRAGALDGEAFIVNGTRPADALVAGAAAARAGASLLLVGDDHVPGATRTALQRVRSATVVGGFGVVGENAEHTVRSLVGARRVRRLAGANRQETAASVARTHPGSGTVHLVSGDDGHLVDAISGSWLAARPGGGPVLYAERTRPGFGTDRWLRLGGLADRPTTRLIGGTGALTDALVSTLEQRYDEAARGGPEPQMRAMWVHLFDGSLKSRAGIERVLDAAAGANLNTVIVQVARRHDAFYGSDVLPRTTDPQMPAGLDLLERLVPAAHARGLEVHAWYSLMPTYHSSFRRNGEQLPADHIHTRHGPDGTAESWMATVNSTDYAYLDPAIPGVQDHVAAVLTEIVGRYDVDGVHLDYLRYSGGAEDLEPPRQEHPVSMRRWRDHGDGDSLAEWRRRQTADLARRISLEVADVDPTVVVSMAAIAQGPGPGERGSFTRTNAYDHQCYTSIDDCRHGKFQDWPSWLAAGVIDVVFPMAYFREGSHGHWFDDWTAFAGSLDSDDRTVAVGQAGYLNDVGDSLAQIEEAVAATDGIALYSYQGDTSTEQGALLAALARGPFAEPAPVPPVPAKQSPTTGRILAEAADGVDVTVTPLDTGGAISTTRRTDATGRAGFLRLAPGRWRVAADGGPGRVVEVRAGEVTRVAL